jgi:hypothetical protein
VLIIKVVEEVIPAGKQRYFFSSGTAVLVFLNVRGISKFGDVSELEGGGMPDSNSMS